MAKINPYNVMKSCCKTCVNHPDLSKRIDLADGRLCEIKANAMRGINQICHHSSVDGGNMICRGIRDYQITMFHRMGLIKHPTDECLLSTMESVLNRKKQ